MKVNNAKQLNPANPMKKLDDKLKQASQMYEKQFLRQMVKAMRNSVSHSNLTKPGMAENIYREQLDDQYVENWMGNGGTGFADLVYNDLVNKFYPQLAKRHIKQVRLVNLSDRYQGVSRQLTKKSEPLFKIQLEGKTKAGPSYLNVPWKGRLENEKQLPSGERVAMFSHPFGLKSTLVFQGKMEPGLLNKELQEGEKFAQLNPEAQNIFWKVEASDSRKGSAGVE
ncbi:MAG: rod-binding protein [Pseudomonadota bacterium]